MQEAIFCTVHIDLDDSKIPLLIRYPVVSYDIFIITSTSLSVPTSSSIGRHCCGGIPPIAAYSDSLPMGIPIPNAPRSPSPKILSPSVTTIAYTNIL